VEVVDDEVGDGLVGALDCGFGSCGFWGLGGYLLALGWVFGHG